MKRHTDTGKWDDPWFLGLTPALRLLWLYLCDRCDIAGVWEVDRKHAEFAIGVDIAWGTCVELMQGRVEVLPGGHRWHLAKYVAFHYGTLSATCRTHQKVIERLRKHGLADRYPIDDLPKPADSLSIPYTAPSQTLPSTSTTSDKGEVEVEVKQTGKRQRLMIQEAARRLLVANHNDAVNEWIDALRTHALCSSAEEAVECLTWAVTSARKAGKSVGFPRQVANELVQWPSNRKHFGYGKRA